MSEFAAKNDLPAQLTEALRAAARRCDDTCGEDCTHVAITAEHDDGRIVYVEASPDAIVAAFAGVRDELVAHLSARTAEAEARVGHAEAGAQLSSERLAKVRQELAEAKATIERTRRFADEMRFYCSPHGVAADYATRLEVVLNAPVEGTTTPARETA